MSAAVGFLGGIPAWRGFGDGFVEQGLEIKLPRLLVLDSLLSGEPCLAGGHILDLHGHGLSVFFSAFGLRDFVIPNGFCRTGAVEEKEIGPDVGVGSEGSLG